MYNNPYNRSYLQYYPQYPQYQSSIQQPIAQQPVQEQIQNIKFLNAKQIQGYIPFPNTKELLLDMESGLAYLVWADNMGISSSKKYSFKSLDEPKVEEKQAEIDLSEYVKVADLEKFAQKADLQALLPLDSIKYLEDKIKSLESQINAKKDYITTEDNSQ